jgi:hypothetical protein
MKKLTDDASAKGTKMENEERSMMPALVILRECLQ